MATAKQRAASRRNIAKARAAKKGGGKGKPSFMKRDAAGFTVRQKLIGNKLGELRDKLYPGGKLHKAGPGRSRLVKQIGALEKAFQKDVKKKRTKRKPMYVHYD